MYRETSITCLCDNIPGKEKEGDFPEISPEKPDIESSLRQGMEDFWSLQSFYVYIHV